MNFLSRNKAKVIHASSWTMVPREWWFCFAAMAILGCAGARNGLESPRPGIQELLLAVERGDVEAVRTSIKAGVDVNGRFGPGGWERFGTWGADGFTALHVAAMHQRMAIADVLLRAGADPNAADEWGVTPLLLAVDTYNRSREEYAVALLLIEAGARPDAWSRSFDSVSTTPLHRAACWHQARVVEAMILHGADPAALDGNGDTALQVARRVGASAEIQAMLRAR